MNCAETRLLLNADIDSELDVANSLDLARHLKTCAACAAEKASLQSLRTGLRSSDLRFRAPDSLNQDVRQFVREMTRGKTSRQTTNWAWLWKLLAGGATVFALLTIFLRPGGLSERDAFLNEIVASHVRSLQVAHLTDVASSDQHTVKPWFDGKLDFAPEVKDFDEQGYPLIGGRLDYFGGRTVAALVYRHNKHLINVFIYPALRADASGQQVLNRQGYSIIQTGKTGMRYYLISDLNAKELGELADLLVQ